MKTRIIAAIALSLALALTARAQSTNRWTDGTGKWETGANWSAGAPSSANAANLITNTSTKTVTVDAITAGSPGTMTISNLTVSAPLNNTNTLALKNAGLVTPLEILFGLNVDTNGVLLITNSVLQCDGPYTVDYGAVVLSSGMIIATTTWEQVIGNLGPAQMTISNGTFLGGYEWIGSEAGSQGTLILAGGTNVANYELALALAVGATGTVLVTSGQLEVVYGTMFIGLTGIGSLTQSGGIVQADFKEEVGGDGRGTLTLAGGTHVVGGEGLVVGRGFGSVGAVLITGGQLLATNSGINVGLTGVSSLIQSNGTVQAYRETVGSFLGSGTWRQAGGTNIVGDGGFVLAFRGTLEIDGGVMTVSTNMVVGDCGLGGVGSVTMKGGTLYVTNAAHAAALDVSDGQFIMTGGALVADQLVMTNGCASLLHTGGTLIVGKVVLDPNAFRIVSVARQSNNMNITWMMGPGASNALQVTSGDAKGNFNTNGFADIFVVTNNISPGTITNYTDVGGATNVPSRYYRVRLIP